MTNSNNSALDHKESTVQRKHTHVRANTQLYVRARTHVHTNRHAYELQITDMTTTNSDMFFLGERESTA